LDRYPYAIWESKGKVSLEEKVQEKVRQILTSHQPGALPEGAGSKIAAILAEAEDRLKTTV
jgi:trimethylamine:corrinoid methyltransferase-like protein